MRSDRREANRRYDKQRKDDPHWNFLRSREWKDIRRAHLHCEPLCRHCRLQVAGVRRRPLPRALPRAPRTEPRE
jgi:hypothetical protein